MANKFSKQEIAMFNDYTEKFEDSLAQSKLFGRFNNDGQTMERSRNQIWRDIPVISTTVNGFDITPSLNKDTTNLAFPSQLNAAPENATFQLNGAERRDETKMRNLADAQLQALASKINRDCMTIASLQGSVVLSKNTAATGFDDVADISARANLLGWRETDRKALYSPTDYLKMAKNLADRTLDNKDSTDALRKAYVGNLSNVDTYAMGYAYRLPAANAVATFAAGLPLAYTPVATSNLFGGQINVDSRFQQINVTVSSGTLKIGDCFTGVGVDEVHHIAKVTSGFRKTFRVTNIISGGGGTGVVEITPPMIATGDYQNVTAAPSVGASLVMLNTASAFVNPFWVADAFEIIPGKVNFDSDAAVMSYTTEQGLIINMFRESNMGTLNTNYRFTTWYGLVCTNPQMAGIQLFNQI